MDIETPRFNSGENKKVETNNSSSFSSLLMECHQKEVALTPQFEPKKLNSPKKPKKKSTDLIVIKRRNKNKEPEPKEQYASFLLKRFNLRNDFDEEHSDEFLLSKEQAFEIPL